MGTLDGQSVIVIGGSSGMGLATAKAAAAAGAQVLIAGRDEAKLARAAEQVGPSAVSRRLDVTDAKAVERFFADIAPFDHLVISAHASSVVSGAIDSLASMSIESARTFMETKFWGPFTVAKHAQHKLKATGSIVFFSGAAGVRKLLPDHTAIGATNGAVEAFARQLAKEIAPKRVNVLAPGLVRTPTYDGMTPEAREALYAGYSKNALVGRVGEPDDIGQAAVYLMCSSYVTGQIHEIDGGRP